MGRAIARGAGEARREVVVTARNGEALDDAVREIEAFGSEALAVPADHRRRRTTSPRSSSRRSTAFGRIDTYIANAMVTVYDRGARPRSRTSCAACSTSTSSATVYGYWAALPHLTESAARFLHVSSALAYRGIPLQARVLLVEGGRRGTFLESARVEHAEHKVPSRHLARPAGRDQHAAVRPLRQRIGYQPQPVPPIYQPEPYAQAVLHCCEHPIRELPISWGAQKLLWGQKLSPRFGDFMLRRTAGRASTRAGQADRLAGQPLRAAPR